LRPIHHVSIPSTLVSFLYDPLPSAIRPNPVYDYYYIPVFVFVRWLCRNVLRC